MPRTRKDGNPLPTKVVVPFTAKWIAGLKPGPERRTFYDSKLAGFALRLEPSGHRSFKLVYRHRKRPRWFDLGSVDRYPGEAGLSVARAKVMQLLLQMAGDDTFDPQGYRAEERSSGTFADDLKAHLADCAKRLKSSEQKGKLLTSVFLDAWANQPTSTITRGDVQHVLEKCKRKATSKKQAKVHLSAFFSWARKKRIYTADNPTSDIDVEDAKIKKGARVLSVDEMPAFWKALKSIDRNDALALKLTGPPGHGADGRPVRA